MTNYTPPTLSRRVIVEAALALMDRDGYAAFSMPKLGDALGIRTPSLYHHFRDRTEILVEVAKTVVLETERPPWRPGAHWTDYFVELSVNFRRTILRHRNTAPVLVQFLPRDLLVSLYELHAVVLKEHSGLPLSSHVLVMDGLERLTIGTALIEASRDAEAGDMAFRDIDPEQMPQLAAASRANKANTEQLFVASLRAFLAGVEAAAP
ncbi:TetR/AcrR family transcriptional regulator [Pseudonocardia spinosispora]|uniref:TetR/AcrR family transcriptional regulator n=1 Tax=Pseudonocardia spinosispora TaxID=103441 RepID=UPI00040EB672|nr:TetR/AcrR family transcriptional regulator [Pseudonocardia spinosispora]